MTVSINVGTRFPAHATSMGHVLLAGRTGHELDDYLLRAPLKPFTSHTITSPERLRTELAGVRKQGYALVDQDRAGEVVAAINVSTHASRTSLESVRSDIVPRLLAASERIEKDLAISGTT